MNSGQSMKAGGPRKSLLLLVALKMYKKLNRWSSPVSDWKG